MQVNTFIELAKQSGVKSWDLMMADVAVGHDSAKLFAEAAKANDATINKILFAPITASDLGTYIAQLLDHPADGLFMYYPSSGGIALIKQQAPFKLFEKYKTVLSSSMVNEILIGGQGDASVGLWSAQSYFWTLPGDLNASFVKAFEERFKRKPQYIDADAYLSLDLVHQAILKAGTTDVDAVRKALEGLQNNDDCRRGRDARCRPSASSAAGRGAGNQSRRRQGRNHDAIRPCARRDPTGGEFRMRRCSDWPAGSEFTG